MDEREEERMHLLKGMYPGLKSMYIDGKASAYLQGKYGVFPEIWSDLAGWKSIKNVQRLYMRYRDQLDSGVRDEDIDIPSLDAASGAENSSVDGNGNGRKRKKRETAWESPHPQGLPLIPGIIAPAAVSDFEQAEASRLRLKLVAIEKKLSTVAEDAAKIDLLPNRPPSPTPTYDAWGKRTNTREMRMREELERERGEAVASLVKADKGYQPSQAMIGSMGKPQAKVFVPVEEYPNYNFIGLILGPRGNTQKKLEGETGCKISIRGKGSVKEGSRGRNTRNVEASEAEPLHVLITGPDHDSLALAVKQVEQLLKVMDDDENVHKMTQLRELAVINGTLRDKEFCSLCGEAGHRQYECPQRNQAARAVPGVKCSVCGDLSHPTRDCPFKQNAPTGDAMDSQYDNFMAELDGGVPPARSQVAASTFPAATDQTGGAVEKLTALSRSAGRGRSVLPAWMTKGQGATEETSVSSLTAGSNSISTASSTQPKLPPQAQAQHAQYAQHAAQQGQYAQQQGQYAQQQGQYTAQQGQYAQYPQQGQYGMAGTDYYNYNYTVYQQQGYDPSQYQYPYTAYQQGYVYPQQQPQDQQGAAPPPPPPPK